MLGIGQKGRHIVGCRRRNTAEIKQNVLTTGKAISNENGLENAVTEIERYFNDEK